MDKKDIQAKIDELVEWDKPTRLKRDNELASIQKKLRRQLSDAGLEEEEIEQTLAGLASDEQRVIVDGVNVTVPKTIKNVKHEPKICELGCGKMAVNQIISITYHTWPDKHWRKKCNFCQYYLLPDGTLARGSQQLKALLIKKNYYLDK